MTAAPTRPPLMVIIVYVLLGVAGITVLVVSFVYLHELAIQIGMPRPLAWTLPVALEVGATNGTLVWNASREAARRWGACIASSALIGSLFGNALSHLIEAELITVRPPLVIGVACVYPAMLFAMIHLALLYSREMRERHEGEAELARLADLKHAATRALSEVTALENSVATRRAAATTATDQSDALLAQAREEHAEALRLKTVTAAELQEVDQSVAQIAARREELKIQEAARLRAEFDSAQSAAPRPVVAQPASPHPSTAASSPRRGNSTAASPNNSTLTQLTPRSSTAAHRRTWIHAQLDAGHPVTGAIVDRHFQCRNGARDLARVVAEREESALANAREA